MSHISVFDTRARDRLPKINQYALSTIRAVTPGNVLLSKNSRKAPPPVEMYEIPSRPPELSIAEIVSPPPATEKALLSFIDFPNARVPAEN